MKVTTVSYFSITILATCFPNYPISAINIDFPIWRDTLQSLRVFPDSIIVGMAKPLRLRGGSSWGSWNSGSSSAKKLWNPENDVEVVDFYSVWGSGHILIVPGPGRSGSKRWYNQSVLFSKGVVFLHQRPIGRTMIPPPYRRLHPSTTW